ncbi:MAG: Oxidoreductase, partial [uncultured Sphingomonas sp.]
ELPHAGPDRHQGQPVLPGRDDVRSGRQSRPRRLRPHHPQGPGFRNQFRRHRRRLQPRGVGGDRRESPQGPTRQRRARHQGAHAHGRRPEPARQLAALAHARGRGFAAPPADGPHRPLPSPSAVTGHRHRGDPVGAHRPHAVGQGARDRCFDLPRPRHRGGPVGRRAARARALPHRAAALLDPEPGRRARGAARLPALRDGRDGVEPAGDGYAHRQVPPRPATARQHACEAVPQADVRRAQAGRGRAAHWAGAGRRLVPDAHGHGLRGGPSGRHLRDHRSAHHGASRGRARRRRSRAGRWTPRPDRRDRPAGRRCGLAGGGLFAARDHAGRAAPPSSRRARRRL